MKLSLFNAKAPALINQLTNILEKLLNKQTTGIDFKQLKNSLDEAGKNTKLVAMGLNSVSRTQLLALRKNEAASDAYGSAGDSVATLNNLIPVLTNMVNEYMEDEESIDDIMEMGSANMPGMTGDDEMMDNGDMMADDIMDKNAEHDKDMVRKDEGDTDMYDEANQNGGAMGQTGSDIKTDEGMQDGSNPASGTEAAVTEGIDTDSTPNNTNSTVIDKESFNFMKTNSARMVKKSKPVATNSNSLVSLDFLTSK